MKATIIILISFSPVMLGCGLSKNVAAGSNMQITDATFQDCPEAPKAGSELPEVGSSLTIKVKNWPENYALVYVVFRGKKSVSVQINDSGGSENEIVIQAEVIRSSGVMVERSETINKSDRLAFTKANGNIGFIEIKEWQKSGE